MLDPGKNGKERAAALDAGLSGKYWDKYVCIAGMFMAYHIGRRCGTKGLRECVKRGPRYFIGKYSGLSRSEAGVPPLPGGMERPGK
jgi:hypothetical protein